ncbi:DJ-1/PfpI family protein [Phaeosphaeriaceae sp. PMI808]|nr:DJ-1/PfpI family protein [Phaeosphaeriaceae sp. PMI808]
MRCSSLIPLLAAVPPALAVPTQPLFTNTTKLPTHFGLLVFPHFQALDVFGPMDVINSLAMLYGNYTTLDLTILSTTMDPVSTGMKGSKGSMAQSIVPTATFKKYLANSKYINGSAPLDAAPKDPRGDIEVLIVPGGGGTRQNMTEEIAFVKELYPKLKYIISVCTGSSILARAGVLDGKNATTNKRSYKWVASTGPKVNWVPTARWVEDGNIWTSSGISAGIDIAYAWIGRVYGEAVAEYLSMSLEYNRETDSHHDPFSKIWDAPGAT